MITQPLAHAHSNVVSAGRVRRRHEPSQRAMCSVERLEQLDAELACCAGEAGRLRFEMGRGLDLLERRSGHHALGFSSIEAYALERCERSVSWSQQARRLARRLENLPRLAGALISGSVNWSMAAVLAKVAKPDDVEAIYLRHRGTALRNTTFLRFACELFIDTWRPRRVEMDYAHIYQRDRHTCQSPCCGRRDVTPHHLRFRAHGGDDSEENLTSLCTWCHLEGIHRGQISATPPASNIRWSFGRSAHTVVEGRRRVRVST